MLLRPLRPQSLQEFWWNYCLIILLSSPLHRNQVWIWGVMNCLNQEKTSSDKQNLCPDHTFLQRLRLCNQAKVSCLTLPFGSLPPKRLICPPTSHTHLCHLNSSGEFRQMKLKGFYTISHQGCRAGCAEGRAKLSSSRWFYKSCLRWNYFFYFSHHTVININWTCSLQNDCF